MTREPADKDRGVGTEGVQANRELWNGWAELHVQSPFYDVEGFKEGRETLDAVELEGVGDVRGKSLLHLQCHFGLDTLSWARRGARVTGVDFSEKAVDYARRLARELGLEARFIQADVTDTSAVSSELRGELFDVVFTSHGTISWLPDLRPWARTIAGALKPGGLFFIADSHPFVWMFDDTAGEPPLRLVNDYFSRRPLVFEEKGSYAVPDAGFRATSYSWLHTFEEIVSSLTGAGLQITALREYPHLFCKWLPDMVEEGPGRYRLPDGSPQIPLLFSATAIKPVAG